MFSLCLDDIQLMHHYLGSLLKFSGVISRLSCIEQHRERPDVDGGLTEHNLRPPQLIISLSSWLSSFTDDSIMFILCTVITVCCLILYAQLILSTGCYCCTCNVMDKACNITKKSTSASTLAVDNVITILTLGQFSDHCNIIMVHQPDAGFEPACLP